MVCLKTMAALAIAVGLGFSAGTAAAQSYPERPISIVVGYPAGGANDIVTRTVGQKMSEKLGQSILVENRGGGGGTVGADYAAKAEADGYTLFMAAGAHALAPSLHATLDYDIVEDFVAISQVASSSYLLVIHPSVEADSVEELIALAQSRPGELNYASSGVGAPPHLAGVMFQQLTGTELTHVPYQGDTPAITDLVGGHVDLAFLAISATKPHIDEGRLNALAVTDSMRTHVYPDLPTLEEAGLEGYALSTWWGLLAPAGVPDEVVEVMHEAVVEALEDPEVQRRFQELGFNVIGSSPSEFAQFIREETEKFARIAEAAGVEPQ
jgi:tripartite-type tricarboxylate transporter receptor subunit TctC